MFFSLVFALVIYIRGTVADTNAFNDLPTTGPTNPIYNIGEVVQLAWSMNFTGAKLTLGQDKAGDKVGGANAVILRTQASTYTPLTIHIESFVHKLTGGMCG